MWTTSQLVTYSIAYTVIALLCVGAWFLFRKQDEKTKRKVFLSIFILLAVFEVIKQIFLIVEGTWTTWTIPIHLCSTFYVWYALACFAKGKWQAAGFNLSFIVATMLFIGLLYDPYAIIGEAANDIFASFSMFHTFFFHMIVLLFAGLQIVFKIGLPKLENIKHSMLIFVIWEIIAAVMANVLQTNYASFLSNSFAPIEYVRTAWGYIPYALILAGVFMFGVVLITVVCHFIQKIPPIKKKEKPVEQR